MKVFNCGDYIDVVDMGITVRVRAEHEAYVTCDLSRDEFFQMVIDSVEPVDGVIDCTGRRFHKYRNGLSFELMGLPEEQAAIDEYLRIWDGGGVVFDLGAYCGVTAYHFAKRAEVVISVEPDPNNYSCLADNVKRHELKNVTCRQLAISSKNGSEQFSAEGNLGSSLSRLNPGKCNRIEVETVTLESILMQYCPNPSLVKMDIEGAEIEVLEGSKDLLSDLHSTRFVVDNCHFVDGKSVREPLERIFKSVGYKTETNPICTWAWR
jgi:FkbM family methyltransferase